jgi:hypothetical protein
MIMPVESRYQNQTERVPVLVEPENRKSATTTYLADEWDNGYKYLFLSDHEKVQKLVSFMEVVERTREKKVQFMIPSSYDGDLKKPMLLVRIKLERFAEAFGRFTERCGQSK